MAFISVYFALGSNLGDRRARLLEAVRRLDEALGCHYTALSDFIETKAQGFAGGNFLNGAVMYRIFRKDVPAQEQATEILESVKGIERSMGRKEEPEYDENGKRVYHSRNIDIDILFFGDERINTERLTIPHGHIAERLFVSIPLRQIAKPSLKRSFPEYFD